MTEESLAWVKSGNERRKTRPLTSARSCLSAWNCSKIDSILPATLHSETTSVQREHSSVASLQIVYCIVKCVIVICMDKIICRSLRGTHTELVVILQDRERGKRQRQRQRDRERKRHRQRKRRRERMRKRQIQRKRDKEKETDRVRDKNKRQTVRETRKE